MRELLGPEVSGGIARIRINRPSQLNALNSALQTALDQAVVELSNRDDVRVLVISGVGEAAFAAGADVGELATLDPPEAEALSLAIAAFHRRLAEAAFAVVASVRGWCLGGGLELAMACDIVVAADDAQFALPEIKLGIIPGGGGLTRLVSAVGLPTARWLAMTGRTIDARRALEAGLIAAAVPATDLEAFTDKLAERLASFPRSAMMTMKRAFAAVTQDLDAHIADEARIGMACYGTAEQRQLMSDFISRKRP
jgi:enoyl-CoA hydratase/carnithine racemase